MLKIGVSACFMYPDKDRIVFGPKTLSYIENDMAHYLAKNEVFPILIPPFKGEILNEIIEELDGFVFQGGSDVAPESYGEDAINDGKWKGDIVRDKYELNLMKLAYASGKPIFGICRGMQLMNVFFGGTLYQDIKTQRPESAMHRDANLYDTLSHNIHIPEESFLSKIYPGKSGLMVNSVHHQSVKDLGKDLKIIAKSEDGIIEAIAHSSRPDGYIFGVQWHPEFFHTLKDELIDAEKLYEFFIDKVKENKSKNDENN